MSITESINEGALAEHVDVEKENDQIIHDQQDEPTPEEQAEQYQFDVIVIGSGPGGYTSAIRCAQLGKSVAVVERDLLGGHAVNWGCVPLNAMIACARSLRSIRESDRYGIDIPSHRVEFARLVRHRDQAVRKARAQIKHFFEKYRVQVYIGVATIVDQDRVLIKPVRQYPNGHVYDTDGRSPYETDDYMSVRTDVEISGKNIIIASGVEYKLPQFVDPHDSKIVDPTRLLWHRNIPQSLVIIGGGVLGCELASLYGHLRSHVVLIDKNSRLLKCMDEQVSFAVETRLKESGVEVVFHATIERIDKGEVVIQLRQPDTLRTVVGSLVVVCTGRKPAFDYENLGKLGIAVDHERSTIIIDEKTCRTSIPTIYACGGIVSSCWSWVPCAVRQGHLAANAICEVKVHPSESTQKVHTATNPSAPFVINVIPAVASVGEVPKSADGALTYTYGFHSNRRAIIDDQTWGFIKMWTTNDEPRRFLAVQLVHEAAAEIIEYYSMMIALDIPLRDVCLLPFAHPTYMESVREACEYVLGQSLSYEGSYLN